MTLFERFVKNVTFPLIAKREGYPGVRRIYERLLKTQYWSEKQIVEYQLLKLKDLLIHAVENNDFYRDRFKSAGFNPYKMDSVERLSDLPLLTKEDIRDHFHKIISQNYLPAELHAAETGGTTGVKMKFLRDNGCLSAKEAALYRFDNWAGWEPGKRIGIVWTAQQDYVGHWTWKSKIKNSIYLRQVVYPAALMDEGTISEYCELIGRKRPVILRCFASPIYEVAKFLVKNKRKIPVAGVVSTGEPIYLHQREVVAEAFACPVYDSYRTREMGPVAQECEAHAGMHVNAESVYVETVDLQSGRPNSGEMGEIVITDLLNYGMPLIRYQMGDVGRVTAQKCCCGRNTPVILELSGRVADMLYSPENKMITAGSLVLYLVDEAPGLVGQVQLIQDRIDHLLIRFTKNPPPSEEIKKYQTRKVKDIFGEKMSVDFEVVDKIEREKSGKYRFAVCKLKRP